MVSGMIPNSLFIINIDGGREREVLSKVRKVLTVNLSLEFIIILFLAVQRLVMPKYAGDIPEGNFTSEYYDETTEHDVLFIGDCEVYENIDPMYLWERYGITSYIRGNAQQLTWQSYYLLADALQYETPKAVVFNVRELLYDDAYREEYNRMTLDGMKWSPLKVQATRASMRGDESILDYIFPLLRYHSRILNLEKDDLTYFFKSPKVTHNGYYMRIDVLPVSESEVADTAWLLGDETEDEDIPEDPWADIDDGDDETEETTVSGSDLDEAEKFGETSLAYLDKMRLLCEEKGIELMLIKVPTLSPIWYDSYDEQAVEYAGKYGLTYINLYEHIQDMGIDYETDTYDGGLHMNLSGADKISEYLGEQLTSKYGICDHRGDTDIKEVYDEKYAFYLDMQKKQQEELDTYGEIKSY